MSRADGKMWIDRCGHRTYEICKSIADFADSIGHYDLHELEDLTLGDSLIELTSAWQKVTVIHQFAERFITEMFLAETSGPYIRLTHIGSDTCRPSFSRILTVNYALWEYGIEVEPFRVPADLPLQREPRGDARVPDQDHSVADACYDYFTNDLMWSEPYAQLLERMADEVFHVLFADRGVLAAVNGFVSEYIQSACLPELYPEYAHLFTSSGTLRRRPLPQWVKKAVFHRERGRCAECGRDLSWVLDSLAKEHFDHVVPLAHGGLNDITNIQLLCQSCNLTKGSERREPRLRYRRWHET